MAIKVGVLGGIGPEATGKFYNDLIEKLQSSGLIKSNIDYPQIIINSIPAPELISKEISEEDLEIYIRGLKELELLGVNYIVMVCNTIYLYFDKLQKLVNVPIIDLRKKVRDRLIKENIKSVFLIGTPNTIEKKLYNFSNIDVLKPSLKEIGTLKNIIFEFNRGANKKENMALLRNLCAKYIDKGADCIFLGCTEFSIILEGEDFCKIDPIDILIDSIIEEICKHQ